MGNLGILSNGVILTQEIKEIEMLPSGNYQFIIPMGGDSYLKRIGDIKNVGDIYTTKNEAVLLEDIVNVLTPDVKNLMTKLHKTFKWNYLFHGPQGTGKGIFAQKAIQEIDKKWEGPVLVFNSGISQALQIDRFLSSNFGMDHNILVVYLQDECERVMPDYKDVLDSMISPSNMITFWITNHLFQLNETLYVDRPSRIRIVHEFENLKKEESDDFVNFLLDKYKKQGLMVYLEEISISSIKKIMIGKSKDYIASELMMQIILNQIAN